MAGVLGNRTYRAAGAGPAPDTKCSDVAVLKNRNNGGLVPEKHHFLGIFEKELTIRFFNHTLFIRFYLLLTS